MDMVCSSTLETSKAQRKVLPSLILNLPAPTMLNTPFVVYHNILDALSIRRGWGRLKLGGGDYFWGKVNMHITAIIIEYL